MVAYLLNFYSGVSTPGATVTVNITGTSTAAVLYKDSAGSNSLANPMTADWQGNYQFYVIDGIFDITNGSPTGNLSRVRILHYVEGTPRAEDIWITPVGDDTQTNLQRWIEEQESGTGLATGTGLDVKQTSPTLITPVLGAASGTSLNLTSLGAELITTVADRDMSGANNWSGTNWSVGAGIYSHSAGANIATLAGYPATSGLTYEIKMTVVTGTAGTFTINYGGASSAAIGQVVGTKTAYTVQLTASSTAGLSVTPNAAWVGSIDNVSIKAVSVSTIDNGIAFTDPADSDAVGTGAVVLTGGMGIAKNLYAGGDIRFTSSLASTSATTGAFVLTGGMGVGGASFITGNLNVAGSDNRFTGGNIWAKSASPTIKSGDGTGTPNMVILGAAGNAKTLVFSSTTSAYAHWIIGTDAVAESGGDAGCGFILEALTDTAVIIDTPLTIARVSAGAITLGGSTLRPTNFLGKIAPVTGTATLVPVQFTAGTNVTAAVPGGIEFDGVNLYATVDTSSGRGAIPIEQYFHLTAAGSTISTIANYFGTTSNIALVASAYYDIEIVMYFLNTTAGTVTWTLTNSAAPTSQNIRYEQSPITGIVAPPGTATQLVGNIYNDATAALTITSGTVTDAVNHYVKMNIQLKNGTGTSLKIQATKNVGGTITPGIGSYWIARRMSPNNIGTFVA